MNETKKRSILKTTIALSLVPSVVLLPLPSAASARSIALWASAVLGYIGITLLLWMYTLGAKSVMGMVFYDLAPILSIHKWLGKYGTLLIFAHPLFITFGYSESIIYPLVPHFGSIAERHIVLGQLALWSLAIVWLTSWLLRKKLAWRTWRYLHWLAYVSIPFALLHVPDLGSQEQTHVWVKVYLFILMLVFLCISGLRVRSVLSLDKSRYEIVTSRKLTRIDTLLKLRPQESHRLAPERGQYIYLKLGFLSEDHPFSVVQYNASTGEITIGFRKAGMYTTMLEKLKVGDSVYLGGPYGGFTKELAPNDLTPVVYLAGGIGITPFVDRIMNEADTREQWLFTANRSRELAVLYAPLKEKLGKRAIAVFSSDDSNLDQEEERGYITADLLRKYLIEPQRYRYYICGPPAMIDAVESTVASLGVTPKHIQSEKFGW